MTAMTTVLKAYATNGLSQTFSAPTSTFRKPVLVSIARKPSSNGLVNEVTVKVTAVTEDSDGNIVRERDIMTGSFREALKGDAADFALAKALFIEVISSDNLADVVSTGNGFVPTSA